MDATEFLYGFLEGTLMRVAGISATMPVSVLGAASSNGSRDWQLAVHRAQQGLGGGSQKASWSYYSETFLIILAE